MRQPCVSAVVGSMPDRAGQCCWRTNSSSRGSHTGKRCSSSSSSSSSISLWLAFSCSSRSTRLLAAIFLLHMLQAACGRALLEAGQQGGTPCVTCDDCVTSSCLRVCQPSCKTGNNMAEGSSLSTDQCKHKGQESALDIATAACKLSQVSPAASSTRPQAHAATEARQYRSNLQWHLGDCLACVAGAAAMQMRSNQGCSTTR